ncbi:MAG TPA: agmatine deiminase family protein [Sandaracinaceae bacterium LLY-WYZ-13_1]|nr:agmatine deiminase family protein [Sandaracinaceae bacterium LLY-WYZ-13_1]
MTRPSTPRAGGYRQPAEWEPHQAVWLAWPSHDALWADLLPKAQEEITGLCEAIADRDEDGTPRGEALRILVPNGMRHLEAAAALEHLEPELCRMPFGDIWMRDIAPIFVRDAEGDVAPVCFAFNGWGGKYILDGDELVAGRVGELAGGPLFAFGMVLEGGAIEADGEGTLLTTRQCLANPNRNPGMSRASVEAVLGDALGADEVLWLDEGLLNDHTDGHVDTVARFVAPGRVVCMEARDDDDPNAEVLAQIAKDLSRMTDAAGRRLQVERIPSPGRVVDHEGLVMPASYVNFYIANTTVVVPTYDSPHDEAALEALRPLFPERRVVGRPAKTILTGGGAFHCITQPQPVGARS